MKNNNETEQSRDRVTDIVNASHTHPVRAIDLLCDLIQSEVAKEREKIAQQAYLECLAVECGEGECARAIRTKFK